MSDVRPTFRNSASRFALLDFFEVVSISFASTPEEVLALLKSYFNFDITGVFAFRTLRGRGTVLKRTFRSLEIFRAIVDIRKGRGSKADLQLSVEVKTEFVFVTWTAFLRERADVRGGRSLKTN